MPVKLTPELGRCLALKAELEHIGRAFDAAGIDFIVLKGLPLAVRLTGRIDGRGRRIRDNDLLVRRKDVREAVHVLERLGYSLLPDVTLESQLDVNFEVEMHRRAEAGLSLCAEVHWAPFPPLLYPTDEDLVWARTEPVLVGELRVETLDKTLTLLQLASHFVQHAASVDWVLRDLAMAWNLWGAQIEPEALKRLATQTGLTHVLAFSLSAAEDRGWLTRRPPALGSSRARLLRVLLPTSRLGPPQAQPTLRRSLELSILAPARQVPTWLWSRIAPPRSLIAGRFGVSEPSVGLRHYAIRTLRAATRAAKRWRRPADS